MIYENAEASIFMLATEHAGKIMRVDLCSSVTSVDIFLYTVKIWSIGDHNNAYRSYVSVKNGVKSIDMSLFLQKQIR